MGGEWGKVWKECERVRERVWVWEGSMGGKCRRVCEGVGWGGSGVGGDVGGECAWEGSVGGECGRKVQEGV